MQILMCGLDHTTTPVEVRERLAFGDVGLDAGLAMLAGMPEVLEGAILSTCNRTEFYAVVTDEAAGRLAMRALATAGGRLPPEVFDAHARFRLEAEAVAHLFGVAAGLESQILGEGQILAQVKDALAAARRHRMVGALLDPIFRFALAAGKRVRTQTCIDQGAVSVAGAAVELARAQLGDLAACTALVLGAGCMGELVAKHLAARQVGRVYVASRSLAPAMRLANRVGGEALPFQHLHGALSGVDLVVCCTDAPHHVLGADDCLEPLASRDGRPLLMLDLAVPRNLDPALGRSAGVTLIDMDGLAEVASRHREARAALVAEARAILGEELARYEAWRRAVPLNPAIAGLKAKFSAVGDQELEGFLERHAAHFTPEQRALVEGLARSIVNKLLHEPLVQLKETGGSQQRHMIEALGRLYGLNVEGFGEYYRRRLEERRRTLTAGA